MGALELIPLVTQGGFAALAVWLVIDTRGQSMRREDDARKREDRLINIIQDQSTRMKEIADTLHRIDERLEREQWVVQDKRG